MLGWEIGYWEIGCSVGKQDAGTFLGGEIWWISSYIFPLPWQRFCLPDPPSGVRMMYICLSLDVETCDLDPLWQSCQVGYMLGDSLLGLLGLHLQLFHQNNICLNSAYAHWPTIYRNRLQVQGVWFRFTLIQIYHASNTARLWIIFSPVPLHREASIICYDSQKGLVVQGKTCEWNTFKTDFPQTITDPFFLTEE